MKMIYILLLIIISCSNNNNSNKITLPNKVNILELQKRKILNKRISSLKLIIGDSISLSNKVIFLYNGYDCETCIDIGYEIIQEIDSISKYQKCFVITTSSTINKEQFRNKYYNYIFYDEHDIIRRELKYIYTPILIKLDSKECVNNVFFPNLNKKNNIKEIVVKYCKSD